MTDRPEHRSPLRPATAHWLRGIERLIYDPIVPDPQGIITSGHENKTGRTVAIRQGERINEKALTAMFKAVIEHNRAGGWRKLQPGVRG